MDKEITLEKMDKEITLEKMDKEITLEISESLKEHRAKLTKVLKEGYAFYNLDPRSNRGLETGSFAFETEEGKNCFVGRLISAGDMQEIRKRGASNKSVVDVYGYTESLHQYPVKFLQECQNLHDIDSNWAVFGANVNGLTAFNRILEDIDLGVYDRLAEV